MIVYLDASAAVKKYIRERGTDEVRDVLYQAHGIGTSVICLAEVTAALIRAARTRSITSTEAEAGRRRLTAEWPTYARVQITESLVERAAALVWKHGLRGYDSVHLASAEMWQEEIGAPVVFAVFDRHLWQAAQAEGLDVYPPTLRGFLARRQPRS